MNTSASAAASSAANTQPDYIAIAMVAVMALIIVIMVIRKHVIIRKTAKNGMAEEITSAEQTNTAPAPIAPGSAGNIKLHDVEPRTAAMLMAIVADSTGIPINELRFTSIREVK